MSKTLNLLRKKKWIEYIDDEREIGNSIIITLKIGWFFKIDPGCAVYGFDSVIDAVKGTRKKDVYYSEEEMRKNYSQKEIGLIK